MKKYRFLLPLYTYMIVIVGYFVIQFFPLQPNPFRKLAILLQVIIVLHSCILIGFLLIKSKQAWILKIAESALLITVALFFLASFLFNLRIQRRLCTYSDDQFKTFFVTTSDDIQIDGIEIVRPNEKAVVIAHGTADNKSGCALLELGEGLSDEYDVYLFDFRGYGNSEGQSTFGHLEILDLQAVLEHVHAQDYESVALIGNSMGGMVTIRVAPNSNVQAVISVSAPSDAEADLGDISGFLSKLAKNPFGRAIYQIFTQVPVSSEIDFTDPAVIQDISPLEEIHELSPIPILIIHGTADKIANVQHAYRLYEMAQEPKDLLIYENGGHSITAFAEDFKETFHNDITNWLDDTLEDPH